MKAMHWLRLSIVVPLVFVSCLINGVDPLLTTRPSNVVTEAGENVTLECSSDQANAIRWLYDGAYVTGLGCSPSSANYLTVSSTQNECDLTILSSSTAVLGPYACGDGTAADKIAQAVVILIDPKPTCGVVGIPIRGENATLSCVMTYRRLPEVVAVIPGAGFSAAISWDSAAGTPLRTSSTELKSTDGNIDVGETLEVDVLTFAGGTEIPSYNCTTLFDFTDRVSALLSYAHNDLSWTCVSAPVLTLLCPESIWLWHNATNSSYPRLSTVYNRPLSFNKTIAIGFECIYEPDFYHITTFEWTVTHSDDGLLLQTQGKNRFLQYYFEETGDYVVKCRAWFDIENYERCKNMIEVPITINVIATATDGDDERDYTIVIIGGVAGGVGLLLLIALIVITIVLCRRRRDRNQERPATPSAGIYLEPVLEQAPSRHYEQLNPAVGDDVPNYDRLHTATPQRAQAQQSTAQDYETIR